MAYKFYTRAGWLTPYALACGYVHFTEDRHSDTRVRMWCANWETGQYDVSIVVGGVRTQWLCFASLSSARKCYRKNVTRLFGALRWRYELGSGSVIA